MPSGVWSSLHHPLLSISFPSILRRISLRRLELRANFFQLLFMQWGRNLLRGRGSIFQSCHFDYFLQSARNARSYLRGGPVRVLPSREMYRRRVSNYSVVPTRGWFCSHFYSNGWLFSHHFGRYVFQRTKSIPTATRVTLQNNIGVELFLTWL